MKRRGVRAATADEVRPSRGVPIEASLGVIETPRIAAAALHVQSTPCSDFAYRITIKMTCTLLENIFQLAADHLSIDGAADRDPGVISLAICSEDPHRSLACNELQQNQCVGINGLTLITDLIRSCTYSTLFV